MKLRDIQMLPACQNGGEFMKNTKAALISETIENTLKNIREEGNDTPGEQSHNERREQAVRGLRKELNELNN